MKLSKSRFKPHALEIMRQIEQSGESVIITDHGVATLEIKPYQTSASSPFEILHGSLVSYSQPTEPVADDDWNVIQ